MLNELSQQRQTTFSEVESELETERTSPDFSSDLSRLAELMHSSLCGSSDHDHDFTAGFKPASPPRVRRALTSMLIEF